MARPTKEPKSKVIKVRISEEMDAKIAAIGGNKSDVIRNLIRGFVPQNEHDAEVGILKEIIERYEKTIDALNERIESFVPQNDSFVPQNGMINDLEAMLGAFGMTIEEFLTEAHEKLESGAITIEGGKIVINECPFDYRRFVEACEENRVDPQKMIDTAAQNIWRSGRA